jgi:O-antigen/teichoic acid export membrane protein
MERLREAVQSPGAGGVLARGSLAAFAVRGGAVMTLFGLHVLLARTLGVSSYGNYVYALTWVQLLALFSTAGMSTASARYVAEYRAQGKPALLNGFLRHAQVLGLIGSSIVAILLIGAVLLLDSRVDRSLARTLLWGALLLPVVTLLEVRSGALRGLKRVFLARLPIDVLRPAFVAMGAVVVYAVAQDALNASVVMVVNILATALALSIVEVALRGRPDKERTAETTVPLPRKEWSRVGFQLLLVAGFGLVLGQTDTLMLGLLRGTTDAGIYSVSMRLASFAAFAFVSVGVMIGPQIAELHTRDKRRELQRILTLGARTSLAFAAPMVLGLAVGASTLLAMFGSEFGQGWIPLIILACGQLVSCLAGFAFLLLTMTGNQRVVAWVLGGSAALNVGLNAALIPRFGMLGAAVATTLTLVLWNIILVVKARLVYQVDTSALGMRPQPRSRSDIPSLS